MRVRTNREDLLEDAKRDDTVVRSILREGQWLFHRGAISVTVSPAVEPRGTDWGDCAA